MADKVEIDIDGNSAGAVQAWQAIARETVDYQRQLAKLDAEEKKNAKSAREHDKALDGVRASLKNISSEMVGTQTSADVFIKAIGGITAAWGAATAGVRFYTQAQQEARNAANEAADTLEDLEKKFQVQSGLEGAELAKAKADIRANVLAAGVTPEQGFRTATQLVSSGFTGQEASQGGLRNLLGVAAASNLTGKTVDLRQIAEATTAYLHSQGLEKTGENVRQVGGAVQRSFKATNLQLADLEALSEHGAGLKTAINWREQLAAMTSLRNSGYGGATGATALESIVGRLQTLSASPEKKVELGKLGLKPEDVDFVGETLDDVLGRLQAGLEKVKAKDRAPILKKLVEEAGVAPLLTMVNSRNDILAAMSVQTDMAGLDKDIGIAQSGRNPAKTRLEAERTFQRAGQGDDSALRKLALENQMRSEGMNEAQIKSRLEGTLLTPGYEGLVNLTGSSQAAAYFASDFGGAQATAADSRLRDAQRGPDIRAPERIQLGGEFGQQNRLIEKQNELMERQLKESQQTNRLLAAGANTPNTAPAGKPAAAGRK